MPTSDLVIRDAAVYTLDPRDPWASAVAVHGGRIAWVGADTDLGDHIGPRTEVVDGRGRLLLPGFIDSHNHVRLGSDTNAVQLAGATSLEEVFARIRAWVAEHPGSDWVEAEGFNYGVMPEGREPTARDLEGVTDGRPAFIATYDVHNVWLNAEALARLGISASNPSAPFGTPRLDERGDPTGYVGDFAVMGLSREGNAALARALPGYAEERQYARLCHSLELATAFGITTIVEPQNSLDDLPLFERALAEGRLRSRLIAALFHPPGTTAEQLDAFADATRRWDSDRLRVGPIKLYIDDVVEAHTAAMLEPFADRPDETGHLFYEPDGFARLVTELDRRGFQTFTHATGDRGIRTALDAIEAAQTVNGSRDRRHQLVHVECVAAQDIPRFSSLGVTACMQPRHCAPEIVEDWRRIVGPERWPRSWPFRSLHEAGAPVAFSSDWNVAEMDPLVWLYSAQTRANLDGADAWIREQTIDLAAAIAPSTTGGAWANHLEAERGRITPGAAGDLVLLSRNLFELPPAAALDTRVDLTVVAGEIVHRSS
jgi:predicted amidohydrolase YtcJ